MEIRVGKIRFLDSLLGVCSVILFIGCILLIMQPLFADGQTLNADAGQAGAWAMLCRYGSIGMVGLWTVSLLVPRRIVSRLPDVAALVLMVCVIWEAVMALDQLYGNGISNHALFRFTGTFLNPGPFCGFISIGVPLAVHYLVKSDKLQVLHDSLVARSLSFVALLTLILCLLLLPAGMSRSAWGAAAVGGLAVYGMHRWTVVKEWCGTLLQNRKRLLAVCGALVLCIGVGWGAFYLKKDSANGRLFMWKVACLAIAERPWTGYGADGFPTAYAEAQERYFASGQGADDEIHVAGTPNHAFNEYLTVALRYGVGGLAVMLTIGIAAFTCAVRKQAYGMAGALLTVAVFAFSSYPLQLPDFLAAVVVLVVVSIVQVSSNFPKGGECKNAAFGHVYRRGIPCGCPISDKPCVSGQPQGIAPTENNKENALNGKTSTVGADWCVCPDIPANCNLDRHTGLPLQVTHDSLVARSSSLVTRKLSLLFLVPFLYWGMKNADVWQARYEAATEWRNVRPLYHMEAYSVVCEDYAVLYERMRWNSNYLFEYGRALHRTGKYKESNRILQETERLCGDPMILNIQGKNYEALGEFGQAATLYQRAYNRLPNRLYPLYLEMEMYASLPCNRMEDARKIAQKLLHTEEKIPSQAVEEMKRRAKEILDFTPN